MRKSANITQIAKECGVSIATVSRVFNGHGTVAPHTRQRVEEAIQRCGYTPNALARSLVSNQTMTLGVIVPDIANPYFSAFFTQIEHAAIQAGYTVFLCNTFYVSATYQLPMPVQSEADYFEIMLRRNVDGVLIIGGQTDLLNPGSDYLSALGKLARAVPVVVVGRKLPGIDCVFIEKETGGGVITAMNYLASLGHTRIAFIGGEPGVTITETRLKAYRDSLAALGLPIDDALVSLSDYYTKDGYQAGMRLFTRQPDFTAALAVNDSVAIGFMRAMKDHSLSVPEDISLISCDQFYHADYCIPRLTSVDQHNELLGKLVIQALLGAIKGVFEPALIDCAPKLMIRESCAPPRQWARRTDMDHP